MARLSTVPRSSIGVSATISSEVLDECTELVKGLKENEAGVVNLDEGDDPGTYRKAFVAAGAAMGITVQVRKQRGTDNVLHVVRLTETEAVEFHARQKKAGAKRSKTLTAKSKPASKQPAKK